MQSLSKTVVCFDLDDTLYKERGYLLSGYRAVAEAICSRGVKQDPAVTVVEMYASFQAGENVFAALQSKFGVMDKSEMLDLYRTHKPDIHLAEGAESLLDYLKNNGCHLGLITDGREVSQNNKIDALGLRKWFSKDDIIISEAFGSGKPNERNYRYFETRYPGCNYIYVGDNIQKDFVAPNRLGWTTCCIKDSAGQNVRWDTADLSQDHYPKYYVDTLANLLIIEGLSIFAGYELF